MKASNEAALGWRKSHSRHTRTNWMLTLPTAEAGGFFLQPARLRRALANTAVEAFCPEAFAVLLLPVSACPAVRSRTATMSSAAARILRAAL